MAYAAIPFGGIAQTSNVSVPFGDGYGIETVSSDSGILLGIILNFCHFLSVLKGLTLEVKSEE